MPRSYSYATGNTPETINLIIYGIFKGKSSIMIYERWGNLKYKYRGRQFWCRGYYVDTAGKNAKKIQEYIQNQLTQDKMSEQLTFDTSNPFKG